MSKKSSLVYQIQEALLPMMKEGRSKYQDKIMKVDSSEIIYSWQTYRTYVKQCCEIAKWCKEKYGCRMISEVEHHVPEYLKMRINSGLSPYTVRLDASAATKLFGRRTTSWGVTFPKRERVGIVRSRVPREHDLEFSELLNKDVVLFCLGTGVRRCEIIAISPYDVSPDGRTVTVVRGKGGKFRIVPVLPQYRDHVKSMRVKAIEDGRDRVFLPSQIKNRMDEHSYRRYYAQALYKYYESTGEYTSGKKYFCRKDAVGIVYDRGIMLAVSKALGHNRIDVISISYLI